MSKLYLGTKEVTPAICKNGYKELPSYQIINNTASKRNVTLDGTEFSGISSLDKETFYYKFYRNKTIYGPINFSSLTNIGESGLYSAFGECSGLTSVSLPLLTNVSSNYCLCGTWGECVNITEANLSSLTNVSGNTSLGGIFRRCTSLSSVDLSSLTAITGSGCLASAFYDCYSLHTIRFPKLEDLTGESALANCFRNTILNHKINMHIYFNSLKTSSFGTYKNQFDHMFNTSSYTEHVTIHFPSNIQLNVAALTGYPNFGGTSGTVTLAFDLPPTS